MKFFYGIENVFPPKWWPHEVPFIVSALRFYNKKKNELKPSKRYDTIRGQYEWFLDSGGFATQMHYGKYMWMVNDYVKLVAGLCPTWYASMDLNTRTFQDFSKITCYSSDQVKDNLDQLTPGQCIELTIEYGVEIWNRRNEAPQSTPVIVIQGRNDNKDDYIDCYYEYRRRGVESPHWAIGSLDFKPKNLNTIAEIIYSIRRVLPPKNTIHCFGLKLPLLTPAIVQNIDTSDTSVWVRNRGNTRRYWGDPKLRLEHLLDYIKSINRKINLYKNQTTLLDLL